MNMQGRQCPFGQPPGMQELVFHRYCYGAPYTTPLDDMKGKVQYASNCMTVGGMKSGACYANTECAYGNCTSGVCSPFKNSFPRAVGLMSADQIKQYTDAMGTCLGDSCALGAKRLTCKGNMVVVQDSNGKQQVVCPIPLQEHTSPQAVNALRNVWQCDRWKAVGDMDAYNQCKALESCIVYDIQTDDGNNIDAAAIVTQQCLAAANAAVRKVGPVAYSPDSPFC